MGETQLRGNIMQGDGVYRSVDAGKTWTNVGLQNTQAIARVRVDRTNPERVFVAAFGHPYGASADRGIFRSTDGGATWKKVLYRNDRTGGVDLVIDPNDPKVVYAALWEAYRTPWKLSSGGPGSGLFKSTDGGDTWTELTRNPGLPRGLVGKIGVTVSGADSKRLWAIVESDSGGVFRSDDAGSTWTRTNDERKLRQRAFYYSRLYADPVERDRVYVLNVGMFRSDDGGKTFAREIRVPHSDNHDLWIAPNDNRRLANANDGGGTVSVNAGETWTDQRYPTAQPYHVITTKDVPYHVCGAQQDNSTFCIPSDGSGDQLYEVGGGESGYIAPHPTNPDVFYAGSQGALLTRFDRKTRILRDVQVYPRFFSGEPAGSLPERWQWTYPIVFSPTNPNVLYTSSQHLWKTTNEGQSWERISPDLTRADPSTLGNSGGPITHDQNGPEFYATIFTVAPSRLDSNLIWTGSDDGLVHVTRDGGKTWTNVTPKGLPVNSRVSMIDASAHAPGTAYLAAKRYQMDDRAPYAYRTSDYGRTWTKIVAGMRADDYVHVVREDPTRAGLLYAGAEHGVYVSVDDGARWQSLSRNLPDVQVADLVVEEHDLVIATHGRSMWVMREIGALRQASAASLAKAVHLFAPRAATRRLSPAPIQYHLARAADSVVIEISDPAGRLVRRVVGKPPARDTTRRDSTRSAATATASEPAMEEDAPRPRGAQGPGVRQGLNSWTWDLRYPGATVFEGMILWSARAENGPMAPPGTYTVKLTANGVTESQPITVRRDPRLTAFTDADLVEQFTLASKIRDKVSAANEAVIRIRAVKKDLAARTPTGPSKRDVDRLVADLSAVEEALYQVRNRSGQDPLNFPIKLNNKLAALQRSVETGDGRPTAGAYKVFDELSAELDVQLRKLDALLQRVPPTT
jgi:photosystem II stability/assembly factor-like uncharacterized protein